MSFQSRVHTPVACDPCMLLLPLSIFQSPPLQPSDPQETRSTKIMLTICIQHTKSGQLTHQTKCTRLWIYSENINLSKLKHPFRLKKKWPLRVQNYQTIIFTMQYYTNPSQLKKGQTYITIESLLNPKFHAPLYEIQSCSTHVQDIIDVQQGNTIFKIIYAKILIIIFAETVYNQCRSVNLTTLNNENPKCEHIFHKTRFTIY